MERFMPNTVVFEAVEFFAGLAVGGPKVTENYARALFQLVDGTANVADAASGHARRIFDHYRASALTLPEFPDAKFMRHELHGDEALPLLIAHGGEKPPRLIFGLLSDVCPTTRNINPRSRE